MANEFTEIIGNWYDRNAVSKMYYGEPLTADFCFSVHDELAIAATYSDWSSSGFHSKHGIEIAPSPSEIRRKAKGWESLSCRGKKITDEERLEEDEYIRLYAPHLFVGEDE